MLIVAHRGGSPDDVENSIAAFDHGIALGVDLLECDLQLSGSGDIVVYHDIEFFGAPVAGFSTDELRSLIPTLLTFDELLEHLSIANSHVRLVLDLKSRDVDRTLVPYLEDAGLRSRVLITSAFSFGLWRLKRQFPDLRTGLSRGATFTRIPDAARPMAARSIGRIMVILAIVQMVAMNIETAVLQHYLIDERAVRMLRGRGRRVYAWTVDSPSIVRRLQNMGIDYLTTNVPALMVRPKHRPS